MNTNEILITANSTLLIAYLFVFQATFKNDQIRWVLLVSFIILLISLISFIWYKVRFPKRKKLHDELMDKSISKTVGNIDAYIEGLTVPYARLQTRMRVAEKLSEVKSRQEYDEFIAEIEEERKRLENGDSLEDIYPKSADELKARDAIYRSFAENLMHESKQNFEQAFQKPLKEKRSKIKMSLDRLTFKFRIHLFVAGCVLLCVCIIAQVLLVDV